MSESQHPPEIVPISTYLAVFGGLMGLTVLTVWVATVDLGDWNVVVAMIVATIKALLVLAFFMHLRHAGRFLWLSLGFGFGFFALLACLTLSDVFTRGRWAPLGPNVEHFSLTTPSQFVAPAAKPAAHAPAHE